MCNSAQRVVEKELSPEAIQQKYEWFKNQSQYIQAAKQNVDNLKSESDVAKQYEADNGKDHSRWSPIVVNSYQTDKENNKQQRLAYVATYNKLVADYNAQSSKWNWGYFRTRDDLPPQHYDDIK